MKLLYSLIIALLLSGCATYKHCAEKFDWKSDVKIDTCYLGRTLPVYIPSVKSSLVWSVEAGKLIAHSGTAHAETFKIHDTTFLKVWQSDSTYKIRFDSALQVIKIKEKDVTTITEKAKITNIMNKFLIGLSIILAIVLIPRLLKKK
jgi:hypothetical protein